MLPQGSLRVGLTGEGEKHGTPYAETESGRLYIEALRRAGLEPVVLQRVAPEAAAVQLDGLAGLCLSGGGDMDPQIFGQALSPFAAEIDRERDDHELALIAAARERGLPILGICRGCQVLNVAFGGDLYQDIERDAPFQTRRHKFKATDPDRFHPARLAPNCALAEAAGTTSVTINSHHHQAVAQLGEGLRVVAWADDGIVEGIADTGGLVYGVQWHPERLEPADQWPIALFARLCGAQDGWA